MTLPLLGVALRGDSLAVLRDWVLDTGRPVEIQDFAGPGELSGNLGPKVALWRNALAGHTGPIGLHGPFFGLDLANPDAEIRAIIQARFMAALGVAEALGATQMVLHSPFTYWQVLNRANFPEIRPNLMAAAADCLAPVLERASGIGCLVVIENIDDTDPADRVELVRRIDHPNLAVSLDTGHADLAHGCHRAPPVVDFIAAAGTHLAHVHLQDTDGYADRHWHPGEGRIPWRPVFDALAALPAPPRLILEVRGGFARLPATVARLEAEGLAR